MAAINRAITVLEEIRDAISGSGTVEFPIFAWTEVDGTALADWVDDAGTTPGFDVTGSEMTGIRWNVNAAPDPVACGVLLPRNFDGTNDLTIYIMASKVGATAADAVTFDVGVFLQSVGDLHDADATAGGVSSAMTGDAATKTVQLVTRTVTAANLPDSGPCALNLTLQPTDGTLDTDDVIVHRVWAEFSTKSV